MPWSLRMLLVLTIVAAPLQSYAAYRTTGAIKSLTGWPRRRINGSALAVALWLVAYPVLLLGSYGLGFGRVSQALQRSSLALDLLIIYPYWIGLILALELFLTYLLIDIVRLVLFPLYKKHKARWIKVQSWLVLSVAVLAAGYAVVRVYLDTFTLRVSSSEVNVANLAEELDGLRIVHIADMQADGRTNGDLLKRFVKTVNSLDADLILFAGDTVTSGADYIEAGASTLGEMRATYGAYACLGDHDHFSDRGLVVTNLNRNGIKVLDNATASLRVGSSTISLTGITNVYRTRPGRDALQAIELQRSKASFNVMVTHQPSPWLVEFARSHGYDLFVAGHTHGGQIAFPLPGFLLAGSRFETEYVSGFYRAGSMVVSVTNGLGLTLAPIRYNAPAEVTLLVLRRTGGAGSQP